MTDLPSENPENPNEIEVNDAILVSNGKEETLN